MLNIGNMDSSNYTTTSPTTSLTRVAIAVVIGLIIGLIIAIIIILIMYYTRTFFFEYCAYEAPYCTISDYIQDPATAIQWGYRQDELFTIENGELMYHPPRAKRDCVPQGPRVVIIPYPQYCTFDVNGEDVQYRQSQDNRHIYERLDDNECHPTEVLARANCLPVSAKNGCVPTQGHPSNRFDLN